MSSEQVVSPLFSEIKFYSKVIEAKVLKELNELNLPGNDARFLKADCFDFKLLAFNINKC